MDNFVDERMLFQAGIFELRKMGRDLGVKCPTSLKKEQLINEILLIINGKTEPFVRKNRRGRPPKTITASTGAIIDNFIPCVEEKKYSYNGEDSFYGLESLSAYISKYKKDLIDEFKVENEFTILGNLEMLGSYGYIRSKNDCSYAKIIYVSEAQLKTNNLKAGDLIYALGRILHPSKPAILIKVLQVNGQENNEKRKNFESLQLKSSDECFDIKPIYLDDKRLEELLPIKKGSRNTIKTTKREDLMKALFGLGVAFTKQQKTVVISLFLEVLPEHRLFLQDRENMEVFFTCFDQSPKQHIAMVDLAIERVKRQAEIGNSVVFIVDGIGKIAKNSLYVKRESDEDYSYAYGAYTKKIYALARNLIEGNSITVIGKLYNAENNLSNQVLVEELEYISSKTISL